MEIILYRLVKILKDCSSVPVKNNNEQLAVANCCRLELLLSLFQGINFRQNNVILEASRELWGDCRRDREEIFFLGDEEPEKVERNGSQEFRTSKSK